MAQAWSSLFLRFMDGLRWNPCTVNDIPELSRLGMQSYWEHYRYLWTGDEYARWYMNLSFGPESLARQMQDPNVAFYFIESNHEPAGLLKLRQGQHWTGKAGDYTELEKIYLVKSSSGKGLGSQVLVQLMQYESEKNTRSIWLKCMDSSLALFFYKKAGFVEVAVERLPYEGFLDTFRNMAVMERKLY